MYLLSIAVKIYLKFILPLVIVYHWMKKPLLSREPSVTNRIKRELLIEDIVRSIFVPQYFPIKGEVGYPPFLLKYNGGSQISYFINSLTFY